MKIHLILLISIAVIASMNRHAEGLLCYTCSYVYNPESQDLSCIEAPTHQTNCTKKYCTIVRQESLSPAGRVLSFQRNCEDKPMYLDAVKEDSSFKMIFRSCTSELCNHSDGRRPLANGYSEAAHLQNMIIKGKPY